MTTNGFTTRTSTNAYRSYVDTAEMWLGEVDVGGATDSDIAIAQVYATLAHAAATALLAGHAGTWKDLRP